MIRKIDKKNRFISLFNPETGFYIRSGVIDENGKETNEDPFMADMPELIDIGVMGSCIHGLKGLCAASGVQCYQNGLKTKRENMSLEGFKSIVEQCKGKVFQYALGGRGDVNKHENFREIVKYCRENNIVPNYTTSGLDLTKKEVEITKTYCGAVAVSEYRSEHTRSAIRMLLDAGVKTNIHYVLGNNTIDEAIHKLKNNGFDKGINAVIFLLHKPVGLGKESNVLDVNDPKVKAFFSLIDTCKFEFKVGFDSCCIPGLLNFTNNINPDSCDTCEGGRYSCYITSDMKMLPCSFDNQDLKYAIDLNENTIYEAWHSDKFETFRNHFRNSCSNCKDRLGCLGGCPLKRSIVLCNRKEKNLYE